jgi:hypothetical protein
MRMLKIPKLRWRFWTWAGKSKVTEPSKAPQDQKGAPEWPAAVNAKEILGLQQLIGNQAVLQMLGRGSNSAQVDASDRND